jgi:phosphoribosyl 1,2-cyclic phosphodiesterase
MPRSSSLPRATDEKKVARSEWMRLYFSGVRGSTPAAGSEFVRYGGNTSCVAIALDDPGTLGTATARPTLVLDAGTGIRRVSRLLEGDPFFGTILMTHLHWDHMQGLPFFRAGDRVDSRVRLIIPDQADGRDAEEVLAGMMSPPHFPIRPRQLRGAWSFHTTSPGTVELGPGLEALTVTALEVPHKGGPMFGYRVSDDHSSVAYIPDHCPTAYGPGADGWGEYHAAARMLADSADVLIHDAQLVAEELPAEASFGHAAAEYAVELGIQAKVGQVVLFHHSPERTDDELDSIAKRFVGADLPVVVANEQLVIDL